MRFRELRHLLQQVVIAGLPITAGCFGSAPDDVVEPPDPNECGITHHERSTSLTLPATPPLQLRINSCKLDVDACVSLCAELMRAWSTGGTLETCDVAFDGAVEVALSYSIGEPCGVGRKPAGLVAARCLDAPSAIGAWLAEAAWLEAVSVHAFVQLARELEHHGAPRRLVRLAIAAARDEVRHAALVGQLAARYGARPPIPEVTLPAFRSLAEIAVENAVEGCVRETFGAVLALWQSTTARDPMIRDAFREIARDEARHAALAWEVDAWIATRIEAGARARVAAARALAAHQLATTPAQPSAVLGLPARQDLEGLLARTHAAVWAGGVA